MVPFSCAPNTWRDSWRVRSQVQVPNFLGVLFGRLLARIAESLLNGSLREVKFHMWWKLGEFCLVNNELKVIIATNKTSSHLAWSWHACLASNKLKKDANRSWHDFTSSILTSGISVLCLYGAIHLCTKHMAWFLASSESSPGPERTEFHGNFLSEWNFLGILFGELLARITEYLLNGSLREVKFLMWWKLGEFCLVNNELKVIIATNKTSSHSACSSHACLASNERKKGRNRSWHDFTSSILTSGISALCLYGAIHLCNKHMAGFLVSSELSPSPERMEFHGNSLRKRNFLGILFGGLLARIAEYLLNWSLREVKFHTPLWH